MLTLEDRGRGAAAGKHQRPLSVTISVRGRFHAFDLARQLQQRGALRRLITTYPKFKVREWEIPNSGISSFPVYEALNRLISAVSLSARDQGACRVRLAGRYDRAASARIPDDTNVFVGWSSESLQSLRRARAIGARTIVERGSTHICFQNSVLADEYARLGLKWEGIHPGMIARELEEYAEADFISVPTHFASDTFIQAGIPARKMVVVPYGCDLGVFRPGIKRDRKFRLIHCGQISIQKGAHILIRAFAELRLRDAELWLIGFLTPEISQMLKDYSDLPIFVKGPFPQRVLPDYYSQGSVFCLVSLQEGLAMVIPQAMSCGLPVIATINSGAAEVVEDGYTGFVIRGGDIDALKEKIMLLYSDSTLRDEMAANLSSSKKTELSWAKYGDRITEAYQAVLDRNPE